MNKTLVALALSLPSIAVSQGLFDIAPDLRGLEPKKLSYIVGGNVGWDSNINPTGSTEVDSPTLSAYIGASGSQVSNRSNLNYSARYTANYYTEEVGNGVSTDSYSNNIGLSVGYNYNISEKLTLSTRANVSYGLEPNYEYGIANTRSVSEILSWTGDISLGYKVNRNFGFYSGVTVSGIQFDDDDNADGDRRTYTPYVQARYRLNNSTYLTGGYRYSFGDNRGFNDSVSHILTLGAEHRFSSRTTLVARVGAQIHDVDNGESRTSPYAELGFRHTFSRKFYMSAFARYSISDYSTDFGDNYFAYNNDIRIGINGTYAVSRKLSLHGGIDYINNQYEDGSLISSNFTTPIADASSDILHLKAGWSYLFANGLSVNGTVNHTLSDSEISSIDYDRTRLSLGASYSF